MAVSFLCHAELELGAPRDGIAARSQIMRQAPLDSQSSLRHPSRKAIRPIAAPNFKIQHSKFSLQHYDNEAETGKGKKF